MENNLVTTKFLNRNELNDFKETQETKHTRFLNITVYNESSNVLHIIQEE